MVPRLIPTATQLILPTTGQICQHLLYRLPGRNVWSVAWPEATGFVGRMSVENQFVITPDLYFLLTWLLILWPPKPPDKQHLWCSLYRINGLLFSKRKDLQLPSPFEWQEMRYNSMFPHSYSVCYIWVFTLRWWKVCKYWYSYKSVLTD